MLVDRDHRMPAHRTHQQRAGFTLRRGHHVTVHVEPVMVEAALNAPRLLVLQRERLRAAHGDRVVPGREALVPVGIGAGVQDDEHVSQRADRRRLVARGQLIQRLHRGLEARRLVAVNALVDPDDRGDASDQRIGIRRAQGPRIRQSIEVCPDRIEPGNILGGGNEEESLYATLRRHSDLLDADPIAGGVRDCEQDALLPRELRVHVANTVSQQRIRPRDSGAVRAPVVEREVAVVTNRVTRAQGNLRGGGACEGDNKAETDAAAHLLVGDETEKIP
jgi:hypothetical protein